MTDTGSEPAPLNLLKMAVGAASLDELRRGRAARIEQLGGSWVYTRNHPRRAEAVLRGGSLYWVIRGHVQARQRITGLRSERDDSGRAYCLIEVEREVVATMPRQWRPFQGWRYLNPVDAPPDMPEAERLLAEAMPERMLAELRSLGLL